MHELSSIFDAEVSIIAREVVEDNDSLEVSIIVPYVTQATPSSNKLVRYVAMISDLNNLSTSSLLVPNSFLQFSHTLACLYFSCSSAVNCGTLALAVILKI
jgi:DNA integrity scanning protein DisA with diadenylate cyclase activity